MIKKYIKYFICTLFVCLNILSVSGQKKGEEIVPPLVPIDENTKLITYQYTIPMKGTPDTLYQRALAWANSFYQNPSQAIKNADTENKIIDCSSSIRINSPSKDGKSFVLAGLVYYQLKIETRTDRYRYTITDFNLRGTSNQPIEAWLDESKPEWSPLRYEHLRQVDEAVKALMENLETAMEPKPVIIDEW